MLQSLLKPAPKNYTSPRSPSKKTSGKIMELVDLESEIISKRPKNVTQFIRDWATSRLGKLTLVQNSYDESDDDEQEQFTLKKGFRGERRFALCINNSVFNRSLDKLPRNEKLQETKSMILIKLKSMNILKSLSNQMLWDMVEDFEEKEYQHDEVIIKWKEPVTNFYIIISGSVKAKGANKKQQTLADGDHFGEDSMIFGCPSPLEYNSQGITRIAHLEGRRISNTLRNVNMEKYKIICRALQKVQTFKTLHNDEMDKVAEIAMNQPPINTEYNQEIDLNEHVLSLFIVTKGIFYSYAKNLAEEHRKDHNREFKTGDIFGTECLKKYPIRDSIVSQDYGTILQIKCSDIERVIGPLEKLDKRRRKRQ